MEGQKFFVYSDENDGIKCLYRYYTQGWKSIVKKYRGESIFDERKVENNAIDYRLPIDSSSHRVGNR